MHSGETKTIVLRKSIYSIEVITDLKGANVGSGNFFALGLFASETVETAAKVTYFECL